MNIYSSVDGTNIDKIIVLFNSVLVNANSHKKESLRFYLLVDKLPDTIPYIPKELDDILEIKELELNDRWKRVLANFNENFYKKAKWCKSDMNFARFLFFLHFPEVERVIYLDWDMIVLADIFELENEYISKHIGYENSKTHNECIMNEHVHFCMKRKRSQKGKKKTS